jgi:hypothetical protein
MEQGIEQGIVAVRVKEAIPGPIRMAGWLLLLAPLLAFFAGGTGKGGQLGSLVSQGLVKLGLGAGLAPLEFLAFAWVAIAMICWLQARSHGNGLGPRSALVFGTALGTQVALLLLTNSVA